jgi:hypothetical protein
MTAIILILLNHHLSAAVIVHALFESDFCLLTGSITINLPFLSGNVQRYTREVLIPTGGPHALQTLHLTSGLPTYNFEDGGLFLVAINEPHARVFL